MRDFPFISVVVPVRNAGRYIGGAIESILTQDYPHERMEIVVVDGMSDDNTREVVKSFCGRGIDIRVIDNRGKTVPYAMTLGVLNIKGEILTRLDGHARFSPNYLSRTVTAMMDGRADVVGGRLVSEGEGLIGEVVAITMSSFVGVGMSFRTIREDRLVDTLAFGLYRRKDLLSAGEYIPYLTRNSDEEHNYRMREMGKRMIVLADLPVKYIVRGSFFKLIKQMYGYGFYKPVVLYLHPNFLRLRQILPVSFILFAGLVVSSLIYGGWWALILSFLPFGLYITTVLAFVINNARKHGIVKGILTGLSAMLMHTSYGLGEVFGILKATIMIVRGDLHQLKKSWYRFNL